ncbi:ABC transporter ATP-binding protein [Rheinheimera sp. F8]|uniref:ABC transporter ATP-binding protein n=1 Tax=Rheinheimera sp. F8 TaxID=1763998 RepID=UPI000744A9D2|nr:ABC transporter ATP-binding protein [Rheinheimera sp. F8]ALZ74845.1 ABC transporter [Rheinheimera sp. F8]
MLTFQHLSKTYGSGLSQNTALKDVSADISCGEMVALCGPSGSGKSTLLNLLGLLDTPTQGQIWLDQQPVPTDPAALAQLRCRAIGFIFQRYNLLPVLTALENVEYPLQLLGVAKAERRARAMALLEAVGVGQFAGQRPDQLSGGQQQRVAIARALVKAPPLVIADEPTANLDGVSAAQVIDLMQQLGRDATTTFLIASHDPRLYERCSRLLTLKDGVLVENQPQSLNPARRAS